MSARGLSSRRAREVDESKAATANTADDKRIAKAQAEVSKSYKEGFVRKSDPSGKNWKRRYVVVDEARQEMIYYGSDPKQTLAELLLTEEPKGTISLKGAVVQVLPKAETPRSCPTKFVFKLTTKERESYFCLDSEKKLKSWAAFIRLAVDSTPSKVAKRRWALLARERAKVKASMTADAHDHAAWILKTDPEGRSWTQRWLVLDTATFTLSYYADQDTSKKPKGVLSLRNCEVEIGSNNPALRNIPAFAVKTLDRTYQFCADGTPNYRLWVNNISACIRAAAAAAMANVSSADMKRPYAGLLKKADPRGKNWKTRWIVLDPIAKTVKYYTDASKKKLKGEFSLKGASVGVGANGAKTPTMYCILVKTADRTWYLCAKDAEDMAGWLDRLELVVRTAAPKVQAQAGSKFAKLVAAGFDNPLLRSPVAATAAAGAGGAGAGTAGDGDGADDVDMAPPPPPAKGGGRR